MVRKRWFLVFSLVWLTASLALASSRDNLSETGSFSQAFSKLSASRADERSRGVYELGLLGTPVERVVPVLIEVLAEGDTFWFYPAETSYEHLDMKQIPAYEMASLALLKIGKPAYLYLLEALASPDPQLRANSLIVLAMSRDDAYLDPIINGLRDPDRRVRVSAARLLGELKHPRSVTPLVLALEDREVRIDAVRSLAAIGDGRAVKPLIELLRSKDDDLKKEAGAALTRITGEALAPDYIVWQHWFNQKTVQ